MARAPTLAFVHSPAEDVDADIIVPLAPAAFDTFADDTRTVLVDDLIDRRQTLPDRGDYIAWQLGWLRRLDAACDAGGALRTAAWYFTVPMDSVVAWARVLLATVRQLAPSELHYHGATGSVDDGTLHRGHLQFWPLLGDAPLSSRLLPLVAATAGVPIHVHAAARRSRRSVSRDPLRAQFAHLEADARRRVGRLRNVRSGGRGDETTLMLWTSGYGARTFASEAAREGRVLVLDRGVSHSSLLRRSGFGFRRVSKRFPTAPAAIAERQPSPAARSLQSEIDRWTEVPGAARVLDQRLATFVGPIAAAVNLGARVLVDALGDHDVRRVAATNPSTVEEFACLAAAARRGTTTTILLQHGDHVFPYDAWLVSETVNFEELWLSDATVEGDLAAVAARVDAPVPSFRLWSPRVAELRQRMRRRPRAGRLRVCYVPSILIGDSYVIGSGYFEDAWYHRWHRNLLAWMEARPEVSFVWKALPTSDQSKDPVPTLIGQRGTANVQYETRHFLKIIDDADAVITDFASTAVFESIHLGIPFAAVAFSQFAEVRASIRERLAPCLRICSTPLEALQHFDEFLQSPAVVVKSSDVLP